MATVGELKAKLAPLPDDATIEFVTFSLGRPLVFEPGLEEFHFRMTGRNLLPRGLIRLPPPPEP